MKIKFEPENSSLEEKAVSFREGTIIFKRGEVKTVSDELGKMLLTEPNKFKAAE